MNENLELAKKISHVFSNNHKMIATAESCTGGLISAYITAIAGSSRYFDRAFVTYSNEAKCQMLGVKAQTLYKYGAVSLETAKEMAEGAIANSNADIAVSVTGIAGPDGGTKEKPVGTVCIGICAKGNDSFAEVFCFKGSREEIREQTVKEALSLVLKALV
ncbi:nicotinamide-nucleotide amidohydrolase family protein [uncultured Succinatimonas sp.]|uniref:CinA family protein n=1 Tax=uncultured Succinatimonas sp. TaxID=1262973 RepID=UPI0027D99214|nr:nicotinamide-nucleotide amidohydrolase family protein [uncultured Succinatimonas sp.]